MTETNESDAVGRALSAGVSEAGDQIEQIVREQIVPAAALVEDAFALAGASIQNNLARAAERGEFSLRRLSRALTRDLARFAIDSLVRRPVENLVTGLFSAPFGGARANGGPVAPGQAFLVGERGPELFVPPSAGHISPNGASNINVHISLPGVRDVEGFQRSQSQIAASMARAINRGQRNL